MPNKDKKVKPKIKVEEITTEPEAPETPEAEKGTQEEKPASKTEIETQAETPSVLIPPKVTSFSQLDTKPPEESSNETPETATGQEKTEATQETVPTKNEDDKAHQLSSEEVKEWLKEVRPDTSKEIEKTAGLNTQLIILVIIALLVLGAIVGGVFYYRKGVPNPQQEPSVSQTPQVTEVSTPTPSATEVDLSKYSVSVLNGSGTAGAAGAIKDILIESGFLGEKIKTGNATSYDYKSTTVSLKSSIDAAVFEEIKASLEEEYDVVKSEEALGEDSTYDIIIIVGAKKAS